MVALSSEILETFGRLNMSISDRFTLCLFLSVLPGVGTRDSISNESFYSMFVRFVR